MRSKAPRSAPQAPLVGYVDVFGHSSGAGGWLFSGWVSRPPTLEASAPVEFAAHYEKEVCRGRATLVFYQRKDVDQNSIGLVAYMAGSSGSADSLKSIAFSLDGVSYRAETGHFTARLPDQDIVDRVRSTLATQAVGHQDRERLLALTARAVFTGQDTLASLSDTVLLEVDEAILCPPDGVLLKGWLQCAPGALRRIRVRSGPLSGELNLVDALRVDRPDVVAAVAPHYGFTDIRCGFIGFVPAAASAREAVYLEVELQNGEVGFKGLQPSKRTGVEAIKRILERVEVGPDEIDAAFDKTLGPAVGAIHHAQRQIPVSVRELAFGEVPASPRASIIVPLYGRIDFVEYQMALFSRGWDAGRNEILYVLDDPAKRRELEILARSLYGRFRIPFRLLLLDANVGFAAANNLGLRAARGEVVCFLNSDVFPITDRWLERLVTGLDRNPDLGVIGARLLFEDGSVQHEGCHYRTLSEFGDWTFVEHRNKGLRPDASVDIRRHEAITGACMVMRRSLAAELGGFDEAFIVGDFEDSDLCLKVRARGLACAVDLAVHLHHLERQSQHSPGDAWRMNLTLYNAWIHQRRWFPAVPRERR